ncbi:unnamed protein product [Cochlearia groenlandica]
MARLQERWRRVARATLLWNLNLASATILFGARASSLLGVLFIGHPRCSVISASGKQNYRAFPAPITKFSVLVYSRLFSVLTFPGARLATVSCTLNKTEYFRF